MIEGIAGGLAANAVTKVAGILLARVRRDHLESRLLDAVDSSTEPPLTADEKSAIESWLSSADGAAFASLDTDPHEQLSFATEGRARVIATGIVAAILDASTPSESVLLASAADSADASAMALEGIVWAQERLDLGTRVLLPYPVDALDISLPTYDPPEWQQFRSELLATAGDILLDALPGTGELRFFLNTPDVMFVESLGPQLASDVDELGPKVVVPWSNDGERAIVDELRRLRDNSGSEFRILARASAGGITPGPRTERLPTVGRRDVAVALHACGVHSTDALDEILRAANGRLELALQLASTSPQPSAVELARAMGDWWVSTNGASVAPEVEAGLALLAVVEPLAVDDVALIAELVGASSPQMMAAFRLAVERGVLSLDSVLDESYRPVERLSFALPALSEFFRLRHWNDRAYGLPASITEVIAAAGPRYAPAVFKNAASSACRGIPVGGVDLDFAFGAADSTQDRPTLALLTDVAEQSSGVCAAAIARVSQVIEDSGDSQFEPADHLWELALTGIGFDLPEGFSLLTRLMTSADDQPPDVVAQDLSSLIEAETDEDRRARLRRALLETCSRALQRNELSVAQVGSLTGRVLTLEWATPRRDLTDPLRFHMERHWITLPEAEAVASALRPLCTALNAINSPHATTLVVEWADKLSRFSQRDHTNCCGRELDGRVALTLQRCGADLLTEIRDRCASEPSLVSTFNDAVEHHAEVAALELPIGNRAALFLVDPNQMEDGDPPVFLENPDNPRAFTWNPAANDAIARRKEAKHAELEEWVVGDLLHDPVSALQQIAEALSEAESMPRSYPARQAASFCYEVLIRETTDPPRLIEPVLATSIDAFPLRYLFHRMAHSLDESDLRDFLAASMATPHTRAAAVRTSLTTCVPEAAADGIVDAILRSDLTSVEGTGSNPKCAADRLARLLQHDDPTLRSAAALEFNPTDEVDQLNRPKLPDDARANWTTAVLATASIDGLNAPFVEHRLYQALHVVRQTQPDLVERWILDRYQDSIGPSHTREQICHLIASLPLESKTRLWCSGQNLPALVVDLPCFVRQDPAWLEQALDEGAITSHDALHAIGFDAEPEDLLAFASALLSRGVTAETLAARIHNRAWSGDGHAHFNDLADRFAELGAASSDDHAKAVASAAEASCRAEAEGFAERNRQRNTGEVS